MLIHSSSHPGKSTATAFMARLCEYNRAHAAVDAALADLSGELLGSGYRLLRRLGPGLYQARHLATRARVMIRVLPGARGDAATRGFLRDVLAAAALHHGHIVHITNFGVDILSDGEPAMYVVMEYLAGEDLDATLAREGPLGWTRVLAIARQVCRALITAHDRGVAHGHIQASSCYRIRRGDDHDAIKLLDFGLAGFMRSAADATAVRAATRAHGERGGLDPRDDIHDLGVLMYRLLTGTAAYPRPEPRPLVGGVSWEIDVDVGAAARSPGPRRSIAAPGLPPALEAVVLRMLALDPELRPADARALFRALAACDAVDAPPVATAVPERIVVPRAEEAPRKPLLSRSSRPVGRAAAIAAGASDRWKRPSPRAWHAVDWPLLLAATMSSAVITTAVVHATWPLIGVAISPMR